jgi:hypothetical protein
MKGLRRIIFIAAIASVLTGCSEPRIDATSDESYKESMAAVRESLPDDRRREFEEAGQLVLMSKANPFELMSSPDMEVTMRAALKDAMHGKTADEVIADAQRIRAEQEAKRREQAVAEIGVLRAKQVADAEARAELANFEISRSRFSKERGYLGMQPVIELTVKNGTSVPVSRAYFTGTLSSPGRSVPWIKESFNYGIRGGLEPGETAAWKLSPNMFSEWGSVDAPDDAVFTVEAVRLDGPDGEPTFRADTFSERDAKRLIELTAQYGS